MNQRWVRLLRRRQSRNPIVTGFPIGEPHGLSCRISLLGRREEHFGRQSRKYLPVADRRIAWIHEYVGGALTQTSEPDGVGITSLGQLNSDDVPFTNAVIVEPSCRAASSLGKQTKSERAIGKIESFPRSVDGGRRLESFPEIGYGSHS